MKRRLPERVADHLQDELERAGPMSVIPTCRELAVSAQVSLPTAMEALQVLASRGFLTKQGGTSRYRRTTDSGGELSSPDKRLLLIRPSWIAELNMFTQRAVDRLLLETNAAGWIVHEELLLGGTEQRKPDRRLVEAVSRFQPSRIISVTGTPLLGRWAANSRVPVLFMGGSAGDSKIPTLGVSLSALLRVLLPRLLASGERQICLPLCGYGPDYIDAIRAAFRECLEQAGLPFVPTYHAPATTDRGGPALRKLLDPVMNARPPTTLIFTNYRYYLSAMGLLTQAGLVPGKSLKVAVLRHEPDLDWIDPRPAHFGFPLNRFWKLTNQWLRNPGGALFQQDEIEMPAEFVPGCGIE